MKTIIYIHKTCAVPDGARYKGKLLWSSMGRRCNVCGKTLTSGVEYRMVKKVKEKK